MCRDLDGRLPFFACATFGRSLSASQCPAMDGDTCNRRSCRYALDYLESAVKEFRGVFHGQKGVNWLQ